MSFNSDLTGATSGSDFDCHFDNYLWARFY